VNILLWTFMKGTLKVKLLTRPFSIYLGLVVCLWLILSQAVFCGGADKQLASTGIPMVSISLVPVESMCRH